MSNKWPLLDYLTRHRIRLRGDDSAACHVQSLVAVP